MSFVVFTALGHNRNARLSHGSFSWRETVSTSSLSGVCPHDILKKKINGIHTPQ